MKRATFVSSLCAAASLAATNAATIITPNTPTLTVADNPAADPDDPASRATPNAGSSLVSLVDGSGLSGAVTTGMNTTSALTVTQSGGAADTYVTNTPVSNGDYFANGGPLPVLTFSLGGTFNDVNSIVLWNYVLDQNATTQFSLALFSDASATTQIGSTITGLTAAADVTNAQQIFFGGGGTLEFDGVQAIQMTLTDNNGGNRVGIGEVRFSQVPEPSIALLGGFGLLALLRRRR